MSRKPHILFVDDERNVLDGLSRNLATEASRWDMTFCDSPEAALDLHGAGQFDVVVVDMMMPGINGIELVLKMKRVSRGSVYIMLTGVSDMGVAVEAINRAEIFRFFPKPCAKTQLCEGITAALEVQAKDPFQAGPVPEKMVMNTLSDGVVMLDDRAQVLFMNAIAVKYCAVADGLHISADRIIRLGTPETTAQFHDLVRRTANGGLGGPVLIERPKLGSALSAIVSQAPTTGDSDGATQNGRVVVYLRDPLSKYIPGATELATLFGLTPAEARIAHSLLLGSSLEEAAAISGIAVGTARNYLKKVFLKTGATRQSDVVRMILSYF